MAADDTSQLDGLLFALQNSMGGPLRVVTQLEDQSGLQAVALAEHPRRPELLLLCADRDQDTTVVVLTMDGTRQLIDGLTEWLGSR
jgi:hypothetical protein